jgi:hypothetical protein
MITTAENDARPPEWTPCIGLAGYSETETERQATPPAGGSPQKTLTNPYPDR